MKKLVTLMCFCILTNFTRAQSWTSLPGGSLDGEARSMISFGGYRWFSGNFYHAGALSAEFIIRHDGTNWVGTPATTAPIKGFCIWNNTLYGAGSFTVGANTYGAVKWNGSGWDYFGLITSESFSTLTVFNNQLVFGGRAPSVDGVPINHLAKWDGISWSAFPFTITCSWLTLANIRVVKTINGFLHVGGDFDYVNTTPAGLAFKTDGTSIVPMNLQTSYHVSDIVKYHDSVFAMGNFPFGPFPVNQGSPGIVKTDDVVWQQVDHGLKMRPRSGAVYLTDLYVGGDYNNTCYNAPCNHSDVGNLGKWNGSSWSDESAGLFNEGAEYISFLYTDTLTATIYALGNFHTSRGDVADFIAKKSISIVPVQLSLFSANLLFDKNVRLSWRDETPADGVKFDVQMSYDGRNFKTIGTVVEKQGDNDYDFLWTPGVQDCGRIYFRLSYEGKYSYVRSINIVGPACNKPRIIVDKQSLHIQTTNPGTLTIINTSGQNVFSAVLQSGYSQVYVNIPQGLYVTSFVDNKGELFSQKVFIY